MKVLIPILSETENDVEFLEKAVGKAGEVTLLAVVDANPKEKFGFAAGFISKARSVMEEVKGTLAARGRECEDVLEWGDTQGKILNTALLKRVDRVVLKKQDNHYFRELVKRLREEKLEVEVLEGKPPEGEK